MGLSRSRVHTLQQKFLHICALNSWPKSRNRNFLKISFKFEHLVFRLCLFSETGDFVLKTVKFPAAMLQCSTPMQKCIKIILGEEMGQRKRKGRNEIQY